MREEPKKCQKMTAKSAANREKQPKMNDKEAPQTDKQARSQNRRKIRIEVEAQTVKNQI